MEFTDAKGRQALVNPQHVTVIEGTADGTYYINTTSGYIEVAITLEEIYYKLTN